MQKLLIGWIAVNNDFNKPDTEKNIPGGVNENGPNYQFHRHFYERYDKHLLLYSSTKNEAAALQLAGRIGKDFPGHRVEPLLLEIKDVIDLKEIKARIESLLLEYKDAEIDIFFSPGTSIMQLSWFICHTTLGLNTRLLQTVGTRDTKGDPVLKVIHTETSPTPVSMILKQQAKDEWDEDEGLHLTDSLKPVYDRAFKLAQTDHVHCLVNGETGTGKELLARYIWRNSPRSGMPFGTVNCAAIGDELLESRLFGYKKGAFTGAEKDTDGLLKELNGGTVFLDEIGDISPRMQQALLRLLQEGEIQPLGGKSEKVDVRVISATNVDLKKACSEGRFRWDLFYRLAVVELELPALRERGPDEADELFEYLLDRVKVQLRKPVRLKPDPEVLRFVKSYSWPGNVREMENFVKNLYVFCDKTISLSELPARYRSEVEQVSLIMDDVEAGHIRKVLRMMHGNQRQTALAIGWVINTLKNKMEKYGIDPENYK